MDSRSINNSSRWRVSNTSDELIRAGHNITIANIREWLSDTPYSRYICSNADVITIQRVMTTESIERVRYWREKGKTVILDFDDSYDTVEKTNPAYKFWRQGQITVSAGRSSYDKYIGYDPLEQFRQGISICSAATVPSRVLASDYRQYGNVFYLPNYIDSHRYDVPKKSHGDDIYIGWGGSLGHLESFQYSGIADALRSVLQQRSNVYFFLVGDKRIAEKLRLPASKLIFRHYVPYSRWAQMVANYDISIAPLSGAFDGRRSFIKALEASIMRLPFIGTGDELYPVYKDFYDSPAHIYVPSEETEPDYDKRVEHWYNSLCEMIDNLNYWQEQTEESFELGMQYDAERNVDNIIEVYREIIELGL